MHERIFIQFFHTFFGTMSGTIGTFAVAAYVAGASLFLAVTLVILAIAAAYAPFWIFRGRNTEERDTRSDELLNQSDAMNEIREARTRISKHVHDGLDFVIERRK
jgi:signal transduction histidine kinase